jgi:hypothetical protein
MLTVRALGEEQEPSIVDLVAPELGAAADRTAGVGHRRFLQERENPLAMSDAVTAVRDTFDRRSVPGGNA